MRSSKPAHAFRFGGAALAISLGLALSGCGGIPTNRSMYSVHQPVVEKVSYTSPPAAAVSPTANRAVSQAGSTPWV